MGNIRERVIIQHLKELNYNNVKKLIEDLVEKRSFGRVVIKPNLCVWDLSTGVTTNPFLVKYITRYFVEHSKEVMVVESDTLITTADKAFDNLGIRKIVEGEGGKVVNLSRYYEEKKYDYLNKPFIEHDLLVNLPVLKTHECTLVTCAMKNLFGMIPLKKRVKHHPKLTETLIKINKIYNKQVIIVDGIYGMEGHGPSRGNAVELNVLIGGKNPAAVDEVACKIMGIETEKVDHIKRGIMLLNRNGVEILTSGIKFEKLIRTFRIPQIDPLTNAKLWVLRHTIPTYIFFVSPLYYILVRKFGLPLRKFVRWILRMEKID